jgi:hypothetical protein
VTVTKLAPQLRLVHSCLSYPAGAIIRNVTVPAVQGPAASWPASTAPAAPPTPDDPPTCVAPPEPDDPPVSEVPPPPSENVDPPQAESAMIAAIAPMRAVTPLKPIRLQAMFDLRNVRTTTEPP